MENTFRIRILFLFLLSGWYPGLNFSQAQYEYNPFTLVNISIAEGGQQLTFSKRSGVPTAAIRFYNELIPDSLIAENSRYTQPQLWSPPIHLGYHLQFSDTAFYVRERKVHFEVNHGGRKMELRIDVPYSQMKIPFQEGSFELPFHFNDWLAIDPGANGQITRPTLEHFKYREGVKPECYYLCPFRIEWDSPTRLGAYEIGDKSGYALFSRNVAKIPDGYYWLQANEKTPVWVNYARPRDINWNSEFLPIARDRFLVLSYARAPVTYNLSAEGYLFNPTSAEPWEKVIVIENVGHASYLFSAGKNSAVLAAFSIEGVGNLYYLKNEGSDWTKFPDPVKHQVLHPDPESGKMILFVKTDAGKWRPRIWNPADNKLMSVPFPAELADSFEVRFPNDRMLTIPDQFWVWGDHYFYYTNDGFLYHAHSQDVTWKLILSHVTVRELVANHQGGIFISGLNEFLYSPDNGMTWEIFPSLSTLDCEREKPQVKTGEGCHGARTLFADGNLFRIVSNGTSLVFDPATMKSPYGR